MRLTISLYGFRITWINRNGAETSVTMEVEAVSFLQAMRKAELRARDKFPGFGKRCCKWSIEGTYHVSLSEARC